MSKLMKKRSTKMVVIILALFFILIFVFTTVPSKISFAINTKITFSCSELLFIDNWKEREIKECINKSQSATLIYLTKHFNDAIHINDVYKFQNRLFVDVSELILNKEIHIIYETDGNDFSKYVDGEMNVIKNQKNKSLNDYKKVFQTTDVFIEQNSQRADPFIQDKDYFTEKNKEVGLQEKVLFENETSIFTVYETIEVYNSSGTLYETYPLGTSLPIIAMKNKTTISNVMAWFPVDSFDDKGLLTNEILLCKEKIIEFRYGRQVGVQKENLDSEKLIIDEWENGVAKLTLQQPFLVNSGRDCVASEVVQRPNAMAICDMFFINKALIGCNENTE